jgi:hypothetical protein
MALTITIDGYGVLTDAETTTGWARTGTISAPGQESDIVLQGSYCVSTKASAKAGAMYYDIGAGNELDFSDGGSEEGQLVYMWVNCTTLGGLETLANGGLRIRLYTDLSNYGDWYFMGSDTTERWKGGKGGFVCLALDPTTSPTVENGTFDVSSVRYFGIYIDNTGSAKSENLMMDTIAVGKGVRVTGTDTDGWDDMVDYCTDYTNRAWGMVQQDESEEFVLVQGSITVGWASGTTSLETDGRIFKWMSYEYSLNPAGAVGLKQWTPMIPVGRSALVVEDDASYTTDYVEGSVVGSDKGRQGSTFIGTDVTDVNFVLYGGNNSGSVTKMYGCTFDRIDGGITWGDNDNHHCYSCTFNECGQFDPVGAVRIRNCIFQNTVAYDPTIFKAFADDGGTFTDETDAANNDTPDDMTLVPATPAVGDAYYFGSRFVPRSIDVDVCAAGDTFEVQWEYPHITLGWTAIPLAQDRTNHFRRLGRNRVSWVVQPANWARSTVSGENLHYYARARVTTGGGTAASGQQAWLQTISSQAALLWNSGMDIQDCAFIANTDTYNDAFGIEHPTSGSFNYYGMTFSNNDYDVLNSSDAITEDSYSEHHANTGVAWVTDYSAYGQVFQSVSGAGRLSGATFWASKIGGITGVAVAKLYEITGTPGTDAEPTGDALATSESVDFDTISASGYQLLEFEFTDKYQLSDLHDYAIIMEATVGTVGNYVYAGADNSSPSHDGNLCYKYLGAWGSLSTMDMIFDVHTEGIVEISNLTGSDADTADEHGNPPGATIATTAVDITIEVEDINGNPITGASVAVYTVSDGTELMNEYTNAQGIAQETYNYLGDTDIEIRIRKSTPGSTRYFPIRTTGQITSTGFTLTAVMAEDTIASP